MICSDVHNKLWNCPIFRKKSPRERLDIVNTQKLCHNCFESGHSASACSLQNTCFVKDCIAKHSMWIHLEGVNSEKVDSGVSNLSDNPGMSTAVSSVTTAGVTCEAADDISTNNDSNQNRRRSFMTIFRI